MYNQLFWYGFDPDDAASSPADKTMFGGTKGKFNGLAYFGGTQENAPAPHRRALSRDNYYDYYEGENEEEDENFNDTLDRLAVEQDRYDSVSSSHLRRRNYNGYFDNDDVDDGQGPVGHKMNSKLIPHEKHYFVTPPNDQPRPIMNGEFSFDVNPPPPPPARSSGTKPQRRRRPRRSPWEDDEDDIPVNNYYDDEEEQVVDFERPSRRRSPNNKSQREGWVSSRVSNWFTDEEDENDDWRNNDDDDDDDDNFDGRPKRRRPRGRKSSSSLWKSPFEVVGSFFGLDNQELNTQAEMYNRQMGIGSKSNQRKGKRMTGRSRDRSPDLRRKGYAYRLDVDMAKYGSVVDADVISDETTGEEVTDTVAEEAQMEEVKRETTDSSRDDGGPKDRNPKEDSEPKRKVRSWEERSIAMERIPPSDVPAWGPSGDLGMDARMKATIDALQDIQEAKYRLEQKIKREQQALDDITILKV